MCFPLGRSAVATGQKFLPELLNRLEPFGALGTLIINQANMARSLQPRSALTPPRSPAPINATRPDFPVRAGQFLGHASRAICPREALATLGTRTSFPVEAGYDGCGDSLRRPAERTTVSSRLLLVRAPDTIPHREQRPDSAFPCRNGNPHMRSRRSRRNGAPWPSADARIFCELVSQRALEALLHAKSNSSTRMREAIRLSERWAEIAPPRHESVPDARAAGCRPVQP